MSAQSESTIEASHADPTSTPANPASSSSSEYIIRIGTPNDAEEISKLIGETWSKFFSYSVSPEDLQTYLTTTLSPETIKKELSDPNLIFILSLSPSPSTSSSSAPEEELVGIAQLVLPTDNEDKIELQRLYTHPSTHGKGLGQILIQKSEEKGKELGKKKIWLGVWEDNKRGIKFYEKVGFRQISEKVFYAGSSKRRDLVMEKVL